MNEQRADTGRTVRVAIIGVGNCASALVQGVYYYRNADPSARVPGLMHVQLGNYHISDIQFTAAFDIDANKVGKDLSEAIFTPPNNTYKFADVPHTGCPVYRGMTHDGLGKYLSQVIRKAPRRDQRRGQHPQRHAHGCGGELSAGGQRRGDQVVC
jgi:myo-inositol-1-phosphate synthase